MQTSCAEIIVLVNYLLSGAHSFQHLPVFGCCLCGIVALSVERQTCDQAVVDLSFGQARGVKTLGKFLTPLCLCHQQYKLVLA